MELAKEIDLIVWGMTENGIKTLLLAALIPRIWIRNFRRI